MIASYDSGLRISLRASKEERNVTEAGMSNAGRFKNHVITTRSAALKLLFLLFEVPLQFLSRSKHVGLGGVCFEQEKWLFHHGPVREIRKCGNRHHSYIQVYTRSKTG